MPFLAYSRVHVDQYVPVDRSSFHLPAFPAKTPISQHLLPSLCKIKYIAARPRLFFQPLSMQTQALSSPIQVHNLNICRHLVTLHQTSWSVPSLPLAQEIQEREHLSTQEHIFSEHPCARSVLLCLSSHPSDLLESFWYLNFSSVLVEPQNRAFF
ncbi:hypothetical protein TWF694_011718 [Orbilia ellipsospora]|uniref:Uncharacterized protein n=1 Tax=Orbilia ellipsospora TaxID=2528407 RepID=A0AAV9X7A6_9PEZI